MCPLDFAFFCVLVSSFRLILYAICKLALQCTLTQCRVRSAAWFGSKQVQRSNAKLLPWSLKYLSRAHLIYVCQTCFVCRQPCLFCNHSHRRWKTTRVGKYGTKQQIFIIKQYDLVVLLQSSLPDCSRIGNRLIFFWTIYFTGD